QVPVEEIEIERLALQRTNVRAPAIEVMAGMAGGLEPARGERCLVGVVLEIRDSHAAAVYRTVRSLLSAHSYALHFSGERGDGSARGPGADRVASRSARRP